MRLFLTLIPDPTADTGPSPSPSAAAASDPPSRVVLALPAAAGPSTIHDLATLIASRFSLALHPAHTVPRLYLSNDFLLPAADLVVDLLQAGDQVTVRYVPRPPGRWLPTPTATAAGDQPAGRKRKRSSYSVSSSSASDSGSVPARPRGPSLKRRRNAADPLPMLGAGPGLPAAITDATDPLLVHQIAETVTRRIAGLIESVLPTQDPMRRAQEHGSRTTRRSVARAASKLQDIGSEDSDDTSASSMDSDFEAIRTDEEEEGEAALEEDEEEEETGSVDPFEDEPEADPFADGNVDPFDDDEDADGDVTPTSGHGLLGTFVDSDESDRSDDDDDLELQAYLSSHARAAKQRPRPSAPPSTMMGLFGPMGLGPAGMVQEVGNSSDDGVSQAFDNLLARINVSVTSRGNSGSDTTSDSDSNSNSSNSDDSSSSSSDNEASESSDNASSSSSDAQSESSSSDSDSDSAPESAPISTATKLNATATKPASARSPSPAKLVPASPTKRAAAATRPGRIWATAVDLAHFPAKRIAPSKERVQLAKAHNAAVANGSATGGADWDPSMAVANGDRGGDSDSKAQQQQHKKTRRGKRGGAGRNKSAAQDAHGDGDESGDNNAGSTPATVAAAVADYATCDKLEPSTLPGMPAGSRIAFKRMQLSAQCTPEVSEYVEYEVVRADPLLVVPVVTEPKPKPAPAAFGNGAGAARASVVAGGWGPEVVLDDVEMDVDQWEDGEDEEEGSAWSTNSKKRKRPTGLAKFMMGEDGEETGPGQERAGVEPFEVGWDDMVEPVIVKWWSGS